MPLPEQLTQHLKRELAVVDDRGTKGTRLLDDAGRLWSRVRRFVGMNLLAPEADMDAMELACYALQLPARHGQALPSGRFGQVSLRDRAEQAAELLVGSTDMQIDESLLDRTARLLHELPQRSPMLDEARLLADAVNLEDFGVTGLLGQTIQLARQGSGIPQVAEGAHKRQQYGYWAARLKDGFHYEPVRQMARRRLEHAVRAAELLADEMKEDAWPA